MSNVLVIGGFTEGKVLLEPIAHAAVEQGFGDDAEVLTLAKAFKMDLGWLKFKVKGMNVITHSAGTMALPDAREIPNDADLPEDVIIIAGPEPRDEDRLAAAAKQKTKEHILSRDQHDQTDHLKVVAWNGAELAKHPVTNRRMIPEISRFSTIQRLGNEQIAGNGRVASFMMANDIFYKDCSWQNRSVVRDMARNGIVFEELPGGHDELLLNPTGVLRSVKQALEAAAGSLT